MVAMSGDCVFLKAIWILFIFICIHGRHTPFVYMISFAGWLTIFNAELNDTDGEEKKHISKPYTYKAKADDQMGFLMQRLFVCCSIQ